MRSVLVICAIALAATVRPAAAGSIEPGSSLPLSLQQAPPPTDADLDRAEAASKPGPHTGADDIADGLGVTNGREEVFRVTPDNAKSPDAGWDGFLGGDGAQIQYRW